MPTITVRVKDGEAVVTTAGFAGRSCQEATAQLERALGKTTNDVETSDMHKPVSMTLGNKA